MSNKGGGKIARLDIVDPIHDFVNVYDRELEIIDSPAFQRLRRIKQLAGAHLTYPGAQHTRFEHSLGVMHLAGLAGQILREKAVIGDDDVGELRLAGLLHDIGHGPFSHLFEEVVQNNSRISHEEMGMRIITKTEIGDILSKHGFDKRSIANLAFGRSGCRFMNEMISGALSADMMDYLLRDGYYTGARHARIDHVRIIRSLDVHQGRLALQRSALYSFESMMHSRYQMFKAVYFHKTVRSVEVMLIEALRLAYVQMGLDSLSLDEYLQLDDDRIISRLVSIGSEDRPGRLGHAADLARGYLNRRLLKCVYERFFTDAADISPGRLEEIRDRLSESAGIPHGRIFVDSSVTTSIPTPPSGTALNQSIVLVSGRGEKEEEEEGPSARAVPVSEIPLVAAMRRFMNILRVYTHDRDRKKVEKAANSILGETGR